MQILAIPVSYGLYKPVSGGQNRFYNIIKNLRNMENRIIVAEEIDFSDFREKSWVKMCYFRDIQFFGRTLSIFRDFNLNFIFLIYNIIKTEAIDLIQITHPSGCFIVKIITIINRKKIPIVYDAHNLESRFIKETFKNNPKYSLLERYWVSLYVNFLEKIMSKFFFDHITVVSQNEKDLFIKKYGLDKKKLTVIPSGCNIKSLKSENDIDSIKKLLNIDLDTIVIIFHGLYSYPPNKEAFDLIENYISPQFKENKVLFLVGGTSAPKIRNNNFISLGFIQDLDSFLSIADLAIVPIEKGAGTNLKIMDYLSFGIPIVTTKKGAEGLMIKDHQHAIITDVVDENFVKAIKFLVDNVKKREKMGKLGRKLAEESYSWDKVVIKLNRIYRELNEDH